MGKINVLFVNLPPVSPELSKSDDVTTASHLLPPLGILSLANRIVGKEYISSIGCIDFAVYNYSTFDTKEKLEKFIEDTLLTYMSGTIPDVVAISLMFSSSYDFFKLVGNVVEKNWIDSTVVVGGIHASNTAEYIIKDNGMVNYVICGEGEEYFAELLNAICNDSEKEILGIHTKERIKHSDFSKFEMTNLVDDINIDFTLYPLIIDMDLYTNRTSLFSLSKTNLNVHSFALMASRGCPGHCTFCASHTVHGYKPRWRTLDNIIGEIMWLYEQYGVTKIYLMDDNFVPKRKAIELFTELSKINISDFEIVIQNLSINHTDHEIIDAIVNARINNIAFAIESGSIETQKKIKKYCNLDKAIDLVQYSQEKGLNVRCFYIIGFPGETVAEMNETFEYAKKVGADWSTFSVAVPLPGSEMYDDFVKLGYIDDTPESWKATTIRDRLFDTPEISAQDIKEMAYIANLNVNFVNNPTIRKNDYDNARIIFENFIKSFDFHIFAYDCLRRINKLTGDNAGAQNVLSRMKTLIKSNSKSQAFKKYLHLLDHEAQDFLND